MGDFLAKIFLKNPIGLIVTGILVSVVIGPAYYDYGHSFAFFIIGIIISAIGILWLVKKIKRERNGFAAQLPLYLAVVDALKKDGYAVEEFKHKNNLIRSWVYLNGNKLGQLFFVAPPPSKVYTQFKDIQEFVEDQFEHDYAKKFKDLPDISPVYWPDNSLLGACIEIPVDNYSEKKEWLSTVANISQKVLSDK